MLCQTRTVFNSISLKIISLTIVQCDITLKLNCACNDVENGANFQLFSITPHTSLSFLACRAMKESVGWGAYNVQEHFQLQGNEEIVSVPLRIRRFLKSNFLGSENLIK